MGAPGECGEAFSLLRVERSLVCFLKSASGTILNSRFQTLLPFSARPIDSAMRVVHCTTPGGSITWMMV